MPLLTQVSFDEEPDRSSLLKIGVDAFKAINWRHNGIGVLQGYLNEGEGEESRFHIWHPSLVLEGMAEGGLYHDHRFDLSSHVLVGTIRHDELEIVDDTNGKYEFAQVTNARQAKELGGHALGEFHSDPVRLGERFNVRHHPMTISAGERYFFPKFAFHGSSTPGLCVTYVVKLNQEKVKARLIVPYGEDYRHAFADVRPRYQWEHLIDEAIDAMRERLTALSCVRQP